MSEATIVIDGSQGEGGGQILRTSVGLAAALAMPVRVENVRAGRQRPGLRPQHLAAVRAAAAVCDATLTGAAIGSTEITFAPGQRRAGQYRFDIGTAGSGPLVLQTILPALAIAEGTSDVTVTGGTHNPLAPCFEYLRDVYGALAATVNVQAYFEMRRAGFYPGGGGEIRLQVQGVEAAENLVPLRLTERGTLRHIDGLSAASYSLAAHIIERQSNHAVERFSAIGRKTSIRQSVWETFSPGTVVFLRAVFARSVAGFGALGARSKPAERVADEAVDALQAFLETPASVDHHAAEQLLTLAALAPGDSRYVTDRATDHLHTNAAVVSRLTGRAVRIEPIGQGEAASVIVEA